MTVATEVVRIDEDRVRKIAEHISQMEKVERLNFYQFPFEAEKGPNVRFLSGLMYPELNHPRAVAFFAYACTQQFGFWLASEDGSGYGRPVTVEVEGEKRPVKGSDLWWRACMECMDDPDAFSPAWIDAMSDEEILTRIFSYKGIVIPFRDNDRRVAMTRTYARYFLENKTTPEELLAQSRQSLEGFLSLFGNVPGYDEDHLQKKQLLLGMALSGRPEHFLAVSDDDPGWIAIMDYHLERLGLRTGMAVFVDETSAAKNHARVWVPEEVWSEIRDKLSDAFLGVIDGSGRSMFDVDFTFWNGRRFCPEMSDPNCDECALAAVCAKNTECFQTVHDTTWF